ncbi:hypothetical protein Tco_1363068 [Tanacetum coccineum]
MTYPRFTKIIINHFLSKQQSITKLQYLHTHTIKDDGAVSRLQFVRIGEDFQEYALPILKTMLTKAIKQSKSYQMFIKYSTGQIPPKKSRGKATRQVHASHARIVTEPVPKHARRRPSGIAFRDTSSVSKKMSPDPSHKLKGVQSLTPEEQLTADTMKALKESKKTNRRQPSTRGSSEGTGVSPGVLNESTFVPTTSSKGTGTNPGVPDEEKVTSESNVILEWGSKQESEYTEEDDDDETIKWVDTNEEEEKKDDDDDKSIDLKLADDEETDDEFMHGEEHVQDDDEETDDEFVHDDEQVNDDEDEEMTNAEVEKSRNGDEEIIDAAKVDVGKTEEDTTDAEINSLLDIKIQSEVPHIQSPFVLTVHVLVISEPSVLTPILKTPSIAFATTFLTPLSISTIPPVLLQTTTPIPTPPITTKDPIINTYVLDSDALTAVQLRVAKLEKDVSELKKLITLLKLLILSNPKKIHTPTIDLEPEPEKSASDIHKIKKEQAKKQKMPKYTIKSIDNATLKEYDHRSALYQTMNENKTFNRNLANHALYHTLMETLIEDENVMDKGVAGTCKKTKRRRTKESESFMKPSTTKETSRGRAPTKSSKIGKSTTTHEPIKELVAEVVMDDRETTANEDVGNDADRPQDYVAPKTNKPSRDTWFKQPPRPPTPDPE